MTKTLSVEYIFHPVGQGLFASGHLWYDKKDQVFNNRPAYSWVYDCGSNSSQALVDNGLDRIDNLINPKRRLDLVVLSHFDTDHISGIVKLLTRFSVGTLMIPLIPNWQRLVLAVDEPVANPATFFFAANPVLAISQIPGVNIDRIVLVPGSGPDDTEDRWVQSPALHFAGQDGQEPKRSGDRLVAGKIGLGATVSFLDIWKSKSVSILPNIISASIISA